VQPGLNFRIACGSLQTVVRVWNAVSGRPVATLQEQNGRAYTVFSPDGQRIVTQDQTAVRVWNAVSGQLLVTLQAHTEDVWSTVFSPDGQRILTASQDQNQDQTAVRVWNAVSGQLLVTLQDTSLVGRAVFSPDGQRILTTSQNVWLGPDQGAAEVWDAERGKDC
jgi:WD40 repeat protein